MTQRDIVDAIAALAEVVKANKDIPGSESLIADANCKIQELIPLVLGIVDVTRDLSKMSDKYIEEVGNHLDLKSAKR